LFNIMQEGDIQIKGYPLRLPLDVAIVFTANPEDYTARGKIVTPLKDRIGSEIRTHYPTELEEGITITAQEAWAERGAATLQMPPYMREIVEQVAFLAREDKRVDKRSGVSQRLPISCLENVISNAERRAMLGAESTVVPRVSDIYAALPAITGKLELEYEGEMKGADTVARDIVRTAIAKTYDRYFSEARMEQVVQWFELGGSVRLTDTTPAASALAELQQIGGLMEKLGAVKVNTKSSVEMQVSAAEFLLEGLHAHKRIGRTEERVFKADRKPKPEREQEMGDMPPMTRRKQFN